MRILKGSNVIRNTEKLILAVEENEADDVTEPSGSPFLHKRPSSCLALRVLWMPEGLMCDNGYEPCMNVVRDVASRVGGSAHAPARSERPARRRPIDG